MSRKYAFVGMGIIGIIAFVTYLPAIKIGFYDGWWYMMWSASMDLPRFLIQFLDPANITQGYRPVQGMYMYLLYNLFGFNPDGYHYAHNLLHAANAALLFLIVGRVSKNWRIAFIAGILYAVFPNYSLAVFWHAVVDPLAGFFYLLTILLWTRFLETQRARDYWFSFAAYLFALFSKEIAIFLPLFLFLIVWWLYGSKPSARRDVRRYAPFLAVWIPYLYLVVQVQSHGEFSSQFGFKIGPHMLNNLIPYMAVLAFPWLDQFPTDSIYYLWLGFATALFVGVMIYKHSLALLFLALFAVLNISPLLGFPQDYFNTRYLYLSTASTAIVLAWLFEIVWRRVGTHRVLSTSVAVSVIALVVVSSARVADAAAGLAEYTRQIRVPFRDISRQHAQFDPDTYLYFVHSPFTSIWDFEGLFFSRYGQNVKVNGTDKGAPANLRDHQTAFVYYFDANNKPIEVQVEKENPIHTQPKLPATFASPIVLEQIEMPTGHVKQGDAFVVILNWRATGKPDRDYTFFAHLVDAQGKLIAQSDSPPLRGKASTLQWEAPHAYMDATILSVPNDAPIGSNYRILIGMYDSQIHERVRLADGTDAVTIEPFRVHPKTR